MKREDVIKQLVPGIIIGFILGFILTLAVGVNRENPIPNYIGGAMCCFVPTLLNCIIVLKGTANVLKRKLSLGQCFLKTIPYALLNLVLGFAFVILVVEKIMGLNSCEISTTITAIYQAILGVVVSTVSAYFVLKQYEKSVKYKRRK